MSTNGILDFQGTNKATFVGENSNVVIDTVNASFGIGVDVNGPTSNLHVVGNAYVTSNLEVGTANLFVDTSTSNVGIGTNAPGYTLDVVGDAAISSNLAVGTNKLFVDTVGGTVGIGSTVIDITDNTLSGAGNGLYIHNPVQGGHLLTLGTQRPWVFEQGLADASTKLCLRSLNSGKKFSIQSPDHSNVMTIVATDGGGAVGIGTDVPDNTLHISGTQGQLVQIQNTSDTARLVLNGSSGTGGDLIFKQAGTATWGIASIGDKLHFLGDDSTNQTRMTFDNNGNVGIGTTSPQYRLDVGYGAGATAADDVMLRVMSSASTSGKLIFGRSGTTDIRSHAIETYNSSGANNNYMKFLVHDGTGTAPYETRTEVMTLRGDGSVGIGTDDPDSGFKLHVDGIIKAQAVNCSGSGPVITCTASNPGDMISKRYASADRYGMGQYAGGITRLFTSTAYSSGRICFSGATDDVTGSAAAFTDYVTIDNDGNVGIGTDPIGKLDIYQGDNVVLGGTTQTLSDPAPGLTLTSSSAKWAFVINSNDDLVLTSHGSLSGTYTGVTGYILEGAYDQRMNDFTGQHRCFLPGVKASEIVNKTGLIVSANKNQYTMISHKTVTGQEAIDISESIPNVSISLRAYDKTCFGVISDVEDPEKREDVYGVWGCPFPKENGDDRVYINSVGEGAIWVTNINGPLESGDYITTSNVAGYGQKQDSEFLANYTVAKITMDCDFNPATRSVQIIRKEMGDVNYWVKTTYKNVSEEEYSNLTEENRRIVDDIYQRVIKEDTKTEKEGYELEVRQELVNVLDEHGQIQWEDTDETEKAYKIRYLDADGNITDEANAVHTAAFVGCTYHCG